MKLWQKYFSMQTGNPGQSVGAVVIITEEQRYHYTIDLGLMDNHTAEWAGLVFALEQAQAIDIKTALVYTDSKLIEDTLNKGQVKMKNLNLI